MKQQDQLTGMCNTIGGPPMLPAGPGTVPNKFPGYCSICGHRVQPRSGRVKRRPTGWDLFH